jgi:hypothetical protein
MWHLSMLGHIVSGSCADWMRPFGITQRLLTCPFLLFGPITIELTVWLL